MVSLLREAGQAYSASYACCGHGTGAWQAECVEEGTKSHLFEQVYWESRRQAKAVEYEVTCRLPGGLAEAVPALLAEPSGAEGGAPPRGDQKPSYCQLGWRSVPALPPISGKALYSLALSCALMEAGKAVTRLPDNAVRVNYVVLPGAAWLTARSKVPKAPPLGQPQTHRVRVTVRVLAAGAALLVLSQAALRRMAVFAAWPSLGPASGGTEVAIQVRVQTRGVSLHRFFLRLASTDASFNGRHFREILQCCSLVCSWSGGSLLRPMCPTVGRRV